MTGVKVEQMLADVRPEAEATVKTEPGARRHRGQAEGLEAGEDELEARVAQMAAARPSRRRSRCGRVWRSLVESRASDSSCCARKRPIS